MSTFTLKTLAFDRNSPIPKNFTGEGKNQSPDLEWENPPAGTREFALVCDDPDAPMDEPFVHWLIYKIPGTVRRLPAALPAVIHPTTPVHAFQGANSAGKIGYFGPYPPPGHGWHHYYFRLYALDAELHVPSGVSRSQLLAAMKGHILGETELVGTYQR